MLKKGAEREVNSRTKEFIQSKEKKGRTHVYRNMHMHRRRGRDAHLNGGDGNADKYICHQHTSLDRKESFDSFDFQLLHSLGTYTKVVESKLIVYLRLHTFIIPIFHGISLTV